MARRSGDERHDRLGHGLLKTEVYIFSFGAAVAIFFMVIILGAIWGRFFVALQQITFWVFFRRGARVSRRSGAALHALRELGPARVHRPARLGMLFVLNLAQWWQMFFIDAVASFMLTPNGGDANFLDQVLNPTEIPLTIHRTVGNIRVQARRRPRIWGSVPLLATEPQHRADHRRAGTAPIRAIGRRTGTRGACRRAGPAA